MLETTSAVHSTSNTAAWASSTTTLAYLFIVLFLAAAAIGGGLVCIGFGASAHRQELSEHALNGGDPSCLVPLNHSGWSQPLLPDHEELAALEQGQFEAARAKRGWRPISRELSSCFDKRTHRRLPAVIAPANDGGPPLPFPPIPSAPERRSIVGLALPQCNASAHPQQQPQLAYIFALPNHGSDSCCTAQNDAAGLAAERAFAAHLLEKSMLADAEVAQHALYGKPQGRRQLAMERRRRRRRRRRSYGLGRRRRRRRRPIPARLAAGPRPASSSCFGP